MDAPVGAGVGGTDGAGTGGGVGGEGKDVEVPP